jgi:uncharacterized Zn finger protein
MLLKTKDGISCDTCGTIFKNNFTYYSFESSRIVVNVGLSANQGNDLDIDVCEKCYLDTETKVRKFIISKVDQTSIKCDYCPKLLRGTFVYHRMLIHKVVVDKEKKEDGPLFIQKNFMDFNIDDVCFTDLSNTAMSIRQSVKQKGDWS